MSDWNPQANEIFLAAVELATLEERQALLDERCGSAGELRAQVESLLAASEHAGDFLERPAVEGPETARLVGDNRSDTPSECTERTQLDFREDRLDFLAQVESPDVLGRIGPYEVTELIGRGGMGIVLKARDEKLNRVVARAHLYVRQSRWQDAADDLQAAGDAVCEEPGNAFLNAILLVYLEEHDL